MTRAFDDDYGPDIERARSVLDGVLGARDDPGTFAHWWCAVLTALRALVDADHGGLLVHAGRRTFWLSEDAQPYVLEAACPRRVAGERDAARVQAVAVALRDAGMRQPIGPIVSGLRLSWTRVARSHVPQACHLLLYRAHPSRPEFGARHRALLDLVGPAVRHGLDLRTLPHESAANLPARPVSVAALVDGPPRPRLDAMADSARGRGLTPRQAEVAVLMGLRRSHKEIARTLGISPNTARRHEERVLKVLGVRRRTDVMDALGES